METAASNVSSIASWVAPHAGARIETALRVPTVRRSMSLPTRERELKRRSRPLRRFVRASLPTRERELKLAWAG